MNVIKKIIVGFWKALCFIRSLVFNLLFIFLLILIISMIPSDQQKVIVPIGSALVLTPQGTLVDQESSINQLEALLGNSTIAETSLLDLLDSIQLARDDNRIRALILQLDQLQDSGFSKLRELGQALNEFKESDKPIYAVADSFSQTQYYLASYADEILMNPMGAVELEGFSSYQPYFGAALDKLNVDVHVFRVGEYKAAVEPYTQTAMSEQARRNNQGWLNELWQLFLGDLARQRSLAVGDLEEYINTFDVLLADHAGDTADLAFTSGLVDKVMTRLEINQYFREQFGSYGDTGQHPQVDMRDYLRAQKAPSPNSGSTPASTIGIIVASGTIYDGEQLPGNIGGDSLAALISQARKDEQIKALVLRIDSGGGSAFASEVIRQELLAFKASGRPVVVSMSSVAASGGYWIAAMADQILANPATITGSIGIFALYPTFDRSLASLGINIDGVASSEVAGQFTPGRPLPQITQNAIQESLQHGYQQFLEVVSNGRTMTPAAVNDIGQGQVWSGEQALNLGLVDAHGNLDDAIATAADLAELGANSYNTRYIKQPLTPFQQFLLNLGRNVELPPLRTQPRGLLSLFQHFNQEVDKLLQSNDPRGLYLQCLECRLF